MLLYKPLVNSLQEVPVETGIDNKDKHFRNLIPDVVDLDESIRDGRDGMCWNPNDENGDVDAGEQNDGAPFQIPDSAAMFGNESDPIDNNLHEQLNLEHPKEENEEQHWYATRLC
jgi:hypothetical protein